MDGVSQKAQTQGTEMSAFTSIVPTIVLIVLFISTIISCSSHRNKSDHPSFLDKGQAAKSKFPELEGVLVRDTKFNYKMKIINPEKMIRLIWKQDSNNFVVKGQIYNPNNLTSRKRNKIYNKVQCIFASMYNINISKEDLDSTPYKIFYIKEDVRATDFGPIKILSVVLSGKKNVLGFSCKKANQQIYNDFTWDEIQSALNGIIKIEPIPESELKTLISSPLLWKAQKDSKVAYLFGTIYTGISLSDLPGGFRKYIDQSINFISETDHDKIDQNKIMEKAKLPDSQGLDQHLSKDSWSRLVELLKGSLTEDKIKSFKPWYIDIYILGLALKSLNLTGFLDSEMADYAKGMGLNMEYLEDVNTLLSTIEKTTTAQSLDSDIKKYGDLIARTKKDVLAIYDCYKKSDISCLTHVSGEVINDNESEVLLRNRNKKWVPKIEKSLESGTSFIAIDTFHLLGEGNILSLLKERGFSIERVSMEKAGH